jgi:two-component system sensor histidine kinase BaeS
MADSKPGVDDRDLPRLFDRLFRVDASRNRATGGSGLGLAICSAIVEAHGGAIGAHHSELGGVEISVQLPAAGTNNE